MSPAQLRSCGKRLRTLDLAVLWSGTKETSSSSISSKPIAYLSAGTLCSRLLAVSSLFPRLAADVLRLLYHRLRDYRMLNVQIYLASSHHDFCCKLHKNSPAPSALPHRWPRARPSERARQPSPLVRPTYKHDMSTRFVAWTSLRQPWTGPAQPRTSLLCLCGDMCCLPVLRHQPSQIAERGVQQPQSRHTLTRHEQAVSRNEAQSRKFHAELRH